ncbi:hypothetical protein H4W34_004106 [Actinomadura algeriensis]|uniref:Uncharacterized protein n=1 Tax=Actinomadura algeriensis TaxID=1679523 RepID=A0ABR9JV44_9ACTN|nr:hypothetical protein [Actinomadura algeriensis]MBE1534273.1 hypothetical protein [Actinomadura algeriensis]
MPEIEQMEGPLNEDRGLRRQYLDGDRPSRHQIQQPLALRLANFWSNITQHRFTKYQKQPWRVALIQDFLSLHPYLYEFIELVRLGSGADDQARILFRLDEGLSS